MEDSQAIVWPRKVAAEIFDNEGYTTKEQMLEAVYSSVKPELWDWIVHYIETMWRETEVEAEAHFSLISKLRSLDQRRNEIYLLPVRVRELVKEKLNHEWKSSTK